MKRRVVITGLGVVTPLGTGVEKFWEALCAGKSGIRLITRFDTSNYASKIAGEVTDFNAEDFIPKKEIKKMDPFIHYALAASIMAMDDAGITIGEEESRRFGVLVGAGIGGLSTIEKYHAAVLEHNGPKKISPFFIPMLIINLASGQIAIRHGFKGPNSAVVTACATGTHAVGDAFRIICRGDADGMIAGGAESVITPMGVGGFCAMKALSCRNDEPEKASRPFDKDRDGFVMGEGAGLVLLEEMNHALRRGAKIYAEVIGYGMSCDAYHISAPDPAADGASLCLHNALRDAQIDPSEVQYVNAHGTSTDLNDRCETEAIKKVFGPHAYRLLISSIKSMTGHLLGAAGGVEAVTTALTVSRGIIPPTINYETQDPFCDLNYVPNQSQRHDVRIAISNSFGFGGTNATLVLKKFEP
ncbi:MAG: beta-ketoacyl-ACP synthase II [bacterium]